MSAPTFLTPIQQRDLAALVVARFDLPMALLHKGSLR